MSRSPFRKKTCLLARAQIDPDAFADFYDAYARRVLTFFARRVVDADTAFDLMSETFAKALAQRTQFRGATGEEEQGWLFAIARSELSHFWRRGSVERSALTRLGVEVPELSSSEIERIEELAELGEIRPKLVAALDELPTDQRRAVELRVVRELGYPDLARELGVSEQVARARVSRGLRALARALAGSDAILEGSK